VTTTDGYYSWPDSPGEMLPDPANPDHIYALSHLGYVFSTDDYGVHWDVLPIISEENYHFSDLSLVNNALYVTGSKGLFKSIDNGKTWIPTEGSAPLNRGQATASAGGALTRPRRAARARPTSSVWRGAGAPVTGRTR